MSLPRQILPGQFYLVTRRCTQRQFLLRPDSATNNAFLYCLAEAANRFEIRILLAVAMSNHHHVVLFDPKGTLPQFTEHFHKMLAHCLNARWGRRENFWSSQPVSVVHLIDRAAIVDKLVYTATNPVKDHLVAFARSWPGINSLHALLTHRKLRAKRPPFFFRKHGTMPATVTLEFAIPNELENPDQLLQQLEEQVAAFEVAAAERRRRDHIPTLNRRAIKNQSWCYVPPSLPLRHTLRPTFATRDPVARREAILRNREFLSAYQTARDRWLTGDTAVHFPLGTYWLRRFANVHVET